jgi:NitT/TauT family transport system ATP-binding protein
VVLHAPTPGALTRARRNLANLLAEAPHAEVRLIANGGAVAAALAAPEPASDGHLWLCRRTLAREALDPSPHLATVDAAVHEIARLQSAGWAYIRA